MVDFAGSKLVSKGLKIPALCLLIFKITNFVFAKVVNNQFDSLADT